MADIFILIHDNIAFPCLYRKGSYLILKTARFLGSFGFVLRHHSEFILHVAANLPFLCNIFRCLSHVVAVKRVPKTIADHTVNIGNVTHFVTGPQMGNMGRQRHIFLPTRRNNISITKLHMLGCNRLCAQTGSANLIYPPSGTFNWKPRVDMRLTCRVLTLPCAEYLP